MKHLLTFTKTCWAVILVAAIGIETYGCSDSVSISEQTIEVPLSSLTITPGSLQPSFSSNTTTYTVDAPTGATTVTVIATPKSSTTQVTIDGTIATQRSISLGPPGSSKIIPILLESQNGLTSTYTVTVTRLLSGDNNLKTLAVTPGTMTPSPFDMDQLEYTVKVADKNAISVSVSAAKSDLNAKMVIGTVLFPAGQPAGQTTIPIGVPGTTTPVLIVVTAANGSEKTYHIIVNHLSDDNSLKDLLVEPGQLQPAFEKGTTSYTVDVAHNVEQITVTPKLQDLNATMLLNGQGISSGEPRSIPLEPAVPHRIEILVIAPNGNQNPYVIVVTRAAPSSNANLSELLVTVDPLGNSLNHPIDLSSPQPYLINVAANVVNVTVTATPENTNATMTIKKADDLGEGVPLLSDTESHVITVGAPGSDTDILVMVTAVNGTQKQYTIRVHVEDLVPPPPPPLP